PPVRPTWLSGTVRLQRPCGNALRTRRLSFSGNVGSTPKSPWTSGLGMQQTFPERVQYRRALRHGKGAGSGELTPTPGWISSSWNESVVRGHCGVLYSTDLLKEVV